MADDDRARAGSRRISFGRRKSPDPAVGPPSVSLSKPGAAPGLSSEHGHAPDAHLKKGRPTPKRSQSGRRRGGPVPPPPTTRREAAKRLRAQQAEQGRSGRGDDDSRLLKRDAGHARRVVRDIIDGRRNVAVMLLPAAMLLIVATFVKDPTVLSVMSRLWVATLLAVVIDVIVIVLSIRRRLRVEPDVEGTGGHVLYGLTRSTVIRRLRMPKPRVSPARLFGSR